MKILVDARELAGRPTGVGRYLLELLNRWAARRDGTPEELVLCAHRLADSARALGFQAIETGETHAGTLWEQWRLPRVIRRERPNVIFCPGYTAPLWTAVPTVVTIHDVSFVAHPEWFSFREGVRRRTLTSASASLAAAILAVSDFTASEVARLFPRVRRDRIHVVRHGVPRPVLRPTFGRARPTVLFVGSVLNRRHVPDLMAAMRAVLPHLRDARLVVAGENRTHPRIDLAAEARRLQVADAVEIADYVDEARLAELYSRARVFAFVSEYEGFGLTPIEALAAGVPPIVADTPVSRETCGDAAWYVPVGDVEALASALRTLLTDERERLRLLEAAPSVLGRYSWERAADETLRIIRQAARS